MIQVQKLKKTNNIPLVDGEKWFVLIDNAYYISNKGRIYSVQYRKIMKTRIDRDGYKVISLKKIKPYPLGLHRVIAKYFINNPKNKPQVNHINGIKTDNRIENLEWCTAKENVRHSIDLGLKGTSKGQKRRYKVQQPLRRKPIYQYDIFGNRLNEFESQTCASEKLGINIVYISRTCNRQSETTNGFVFRFKDDPNQEIKPSRKSLYANGVIKT